MDDHTFQTWLDTAVKGIRFGPDRRAVRAELAGHLEDRAADLRRIFPDLTDQEPKSGPWRGWGTPRRSASSWPGSTGPGWGISGGSPRCCWPSA